MFEKISASLTWGPSGRRDSWVKRYAVPENLDTQDLVEMAEHAPVPIADPEVSFYADCARDPERWSFDRFFQQEEELRNIHSIRFDIPAWNACIKTGGRMIDLYCYPPRSEELPDLELDDILGSLPEHRRVRERKEPIETLFRRVNFGEELDPAIDSFRGWRIWKLYKLREERDLAPSVARFLEERPDVREERAYVTVWGDPESPFLHEPSYLLVENRWDMWHTVLEADWNAACRRVKDFTAREPDLAAACRDNQIHVIGGNCEHFWDSFDQKEYRVTIEEYPGSADDGAPNGFVTLVCEDGRKWSE